MKHLQHYLMVCTSSYLHFSIINFQYKIVGKGKCHWLETSSTQVCFVCLALPTQMSERWNEVFGNEPTERLMVGASNCHLPVRILVWLIKGTEYQDFRYWRIDNKNPDQVAASKKRKAEYQVLISDYPSIHLHLTSLVTLMPLITLVTLIILEPLVHLSIC